MVCQLSCADARSPPRFALFLSGFAGLVYEVCWIRRGSLVFGSTVLATSTVVAVFFLGLALGSWAAGRFGSRATNPLRVYAGIEVATAILGLASLATFESIDGLYGGAYRALAARPWALLGTRAALVAIVLLPAAVAMGATLPLVRAPRRGIAPRGGGGRRALRAQHAGCGDRVRDDRVAADSPPRVTRVDRDRRRRQSRRRGLRLDRVAGAGGDRNRGRAQSARGRLESSGARSLPVPRAVVTGLFFVTGLVALALEVLWTPLPGTRAPHHRADVYGEPDRGAGRDRDRQRAGVAIARAPARERARSPCSRW